MQPWRVGFGTAAAAYRLEVKLMKKLVIVCAAIVLLLLVFGCVITPQATGQPANGSSSGDEISVPQNDSAPPPLPDQTSPSDNGPPPLPA